MKNRTSEEMEKILDEELKGWARSQPKPCPFCGEEIAIEITVPALGNSNTAYTQTRGARIQCRRCKGTMVADPSEIQDVIREYIIAKWNRRATDRKEEKEHE